MNILITEDKDFILSIFIEDGSGGFLYVKQFKEEGIFELKRRLEAISSSESPYDLIKEWGDCENPNSKQWRDYFFRDDLKLIYSSKKGIFFGNLGESGKMIFKREKD